MNQSNLKSLGVVVGLALGVASVAIGAVPHSFMARDALRASELNDNFEALDANVCGGSTSNTRGNLGGYAGAAAICRGVASCDGQRAHICTSGEVALHLALNQPLPNGLMGNKYWYASADFAVAGLGDCRSWTMDTGDGAHVLDLTGGAPNPTGDSCTSMYRVLCCD